MKRLIFFSLSVSCSLQSGYLQNGGSYGKQRPGYVPPFVIFYIVETGEIKKVTWGRRKVYSLKRLTVDGGRFFGEKSYSDEPGSTVERGLLLIPIIQIFILFLFSFLDNILQKACRSNGVKAHSWKEVFGSVVVVVHLLGNL